ncbi:MAG: phage protease [Clostridia bacterium]|nr:phage protease [Clostridia bacterium]
MNRQNLELFGLSEGATKEDIKAAYDNLRAKYLEERFMDGEVGNNAAKMLTRIEVAYNELMSEISEAGAADDSESAYAKVEELIKAGDVQEAQRVLDGFNERGGQWHYLQSVVFYRKNWMNESKKQLEIAIQLEPENEKYKTAYKKLNDKLSYDAQNGGGANQGVYRGQSINSDSDEQMGGNFCAQCIQCCYINMCINCLCNSCCR